MSGLPPTTNSGLGNVSVKGRIRSPRPAARIIAFIRTFAAPLLVLTWVKSVALSNAHIHATHHSTPPLGQYSVRFEEYRLSSLLFRRGDTNVQKYRSLWCGAVGPLSQTTGGSPLN